MILHAVDQDPATPRIHSAQQQQSPSAMVPDAISQSSTSSPKSQKTSLDPNASQVSDSTLASAAAHEITPPSSVASSQEQEDVDRQLAEEAGLGGMAASSNVAGRKRTANGQVKETGRPVGSGRLPNGPGHARNESTLSQASNTSLGELSQQLRTKLTYAMIKVQNGWQKHSLDEIESIASQSPCSNLSGFTPRDFQSIVSPRSVIAAGMRQNSDASSSSDHSFQQQPTLMTLSATKPATSDANKGLAPPASIIPGNRRKAPTNVRLQINSSLKAPSRSTRPATTQRTPSQNAAMEADAVETLLFMSASPSNSGHFPSHLSAYSPTSQAFSTQASPLKSHFSMNDRNYPMSAVEYSPQSSTRRVRYEDKAALIDRLLNDLDDDESEELDRAMRIMDQYQAAKLSA